MPPKSRPDESSRRMRWLLLKGGVLLCLVSAFLGGVIWSGRWGKEQLRGNKQFTVEFADIECDPPAGMDRHKFLDEVLYYASPRLSKKIDLLDENLRDHLKEGFARHPWVEKVDDVTIVPAVKVGAEMLAVDGSGVALPKNAPTDGLPIYVGDAKAPRAIGQRWGDPNVEAAARKARK
jgi:hypothetical protein